MVPIIHSKEQVGGVLIYIMTHCYVKRYLRGDKRVGVDTSLTRKRNQSTQKGFIILLYI